MDAGYYVIIVQQNHFTMKNIIALLLASATLSYGAANDLLIAQRNSTDTGQLTRLVAHLGGSQNGFVVYNGTSLLPQIVLLGDGLSWGSGQVDVTMSSAMTTALATKQDNLGFGLSSQYLKGDHTWATLDKSAVGLSNVENTALSTWIGSSNLTTVGTLASGVWQGTPVTDTYISSASTWNSKLSPTGSGASLTGLTKGQVGLGNVENTALSTWGGSTNLTTVGIVTVGTWQGTAVADSYIASASTWNGKLSPSGNGSSLTGLTKSQVGLSNVDNTSDLGKPISTATQTALNGKFANPIGSTSQYLRGDGSLATLPTYPAYTTTTQTRSFNSSFQVSSTKDTNVRYTVEISSSISLSGTNAGTVFLETSSDNSTWVEEGRIVNSQSGGLVVGLSLGQNISGQLSAYVPANYWVRLRSSATSGTPTFTYRVGRETLLS